MPDYDLIAILGPTASGKTPFAAALAAELNTEIISADSRQIYRGMDLGTGKDLEDYTINGRQIPYHLIDIADPGYKYNVFEYQRDFLTAYETIKQKGCLPVLCGGTGLSGVGTKRLSPDSSSRKPRVACTPGRKIIGRTDCYFKQL